jgi:phosphopantetheinyl transferase
MQTEIKVYCLYYSDDTAEGQRARSLRLLKSVLGVDRRDQLEFGEHGKPYLKDGLYFSLSDEDGLIVLAVSEKEIGTDVHQIGIADESVIRRYFTEDEYNSFIEAPDSEKPLIFGILWSRIEASLKCIGTGLDLDFRNHRDMIDHLYVKHKLLEGGYMLACACDTDFELKIITLSDDVA